MKFEVGSVAVWPGHGLVILKRIENKVIGRHTKEFLIFEGVINRMTLMTPIDTQVAIRKVIEPTEAKRMLERLTSAVPAVERQDTWNKRYREYMERIQVGTPEDLETVFSDLIGLRNSKDLSFGERKMLDRSAELLSVELGHVLRIPAQALFEQLMTRQVAC